MNRLLATAAISCLLAVGCGRSTRNTSTTNTTKTASPTTSSQAAPTAAADACVIVDQATAGAILGSAAPTPQHLTAVPGGSRCLYDLGGGNGLEADVDEDGSLGATRIRALQGQAGVKTLTLCDVGIFQQKDLLGNQRLWLVKGTAEVSVENAATSPSSAFTEGIFTKIANRFGC